MHQFLNKKSPLILKLKLSCSPKSINEVLSINHGLLPRLKVNGRLKGQVNSLQVPNVLLMQHAPLILHQVATHVDVPRLAHLLQHGPGHLDDILELIAHGVGDFCVAFLALLVARLNELGAALLRASHRRHLNALVVVLASRAVAIEVVGLLEIVKSRLGQVEELNVRDPDLIPLQLWNIFSQSNAELRTVEGGDGIGFAAVIENRRGEVDPSADGVQVVVENVEAVDAETTVDAKELCLVGQMLGHEVLLEHAVQALDVLLSLLIPLYVVQVRHEVVELPVAVTRVVELLQVAAILELPDDLRHHACGVWQGSGCDFFHAETLVLVLGPGIALAEHPAVVRELTAAAFEELSSRQAEVAALFDVFGFDGIREGLFLENQRSFGQRLGLLAAHHLTLIAFNCLNSLPWCDHFN